MGNLLAALVNSAESMRAYQKALDAVSNNVANASTPGYAKQNLNFQAKSFQLDQGIIGGVSTGTVLSSRDEFAEQQVRSQSEYAGYDSQKTQDLGKLEAIFNITGTGGIGPALNAFFNSASQLSVNPNDSASRQALIDHAGQLARAFNQTGNAIGAAGPAADQQIQGTIGQINNLAAKIAQVNAARRQNFSASHDAGLDAQLHNDLEELSSLTDYTVLPESDGTVSVFAGAQVPLVLGDRQYKLSGDFSGSQAHLLDSQGNDITATVTRGQIAAQLDTRNNVIPGLLANVGALAQNVADQVNATLAGGVDAQGNAPAVGLFNYSPTDPAGTLAVTGLTASQLAAAIPSAPGGNENALNLAALGNTPQINGSTYAQDYGQLAGGVGRALKNAQDDSQVRQDLLTQAQTVRSGASGVSLDEEAAHLLTLQRGYQANAKLLTTLNDLSAVALAIIK